MSEARSPVQRKKPKLAKQLHRRLPAFLQGLLCSFSTPPLQQRSIRDTTRSMRRALPCVGCLLGYSGEQYKLPPPERRRSSFAISCRHLAPSTQLCTLTYLTAPSKTCQMHMRSHYPHAIDSCAGAAWKAARLVMVRRRRHPARPAKHRTK